MWLGDFKFGSTVHFKFTTVNTGGFPTAFSSGGVTVYRDASTVQDTTGITLTSSFDTITGLNHVQVDMSTAGFYSSAGTYCAIISSGAASTDLGGYTLAHWSLLDRSPLTSTLGIETVSTAGLETLSTVGLETLSTVGLETLSTAGLETVSTAGLETVSSSIIAGSVWHATRASFVGVGSFGQLVSTSTAAPDQWVAISTAGLETLSTVGLETASSNVSVAEWRGTIPSTLGPNANLQISTATLISTAQNIATVATVTGNVNGSVGSVAADVNVSTGSEASVADTVWDEVLTGATHNIATSAGRRLRELADANVIASGTFQAGSTTSSLVLAAGEPATDNFYRHTIIRMIDGAAAGQERVISSYNGTTKAAVVSPALVTAAPSSGDEYQIISGGAVHAATVAPGYVGGAVWVDTVNGTAGTELYVNGTADNPVDSIADAKTIADDLNLKVLHFLPGSSVTLAATFDNFEFMGFEYTVALGGQSVSGAVFLNATVTGNDDGSNGTATIYSNCVMGSNTLGKHVMMGCRMSGTITLQEATDYYWDQCYSGVAGTGTPAVDFQAAAEAKNLSIRHYSGGMEFQNHGNTGTHTSSIEGRGQVVLNVNCAGGTIAIRGHFTVTDNAGGAVTLSEDARTDRGQTASFVWDSTRASHTIAGTFGEANQSTSVPSTNVNVLEWGGSTVGALPLSSTAGLETASSNVSVMEWRGVTPSTLGPNSNLQVSTATLISTAQTIASVSTSQIITLSGLNSTLDSSDVNAEVVDAIATDTYEEPSFGVPSTAQSFSGMLGYLFSALRNGVTVGSSAKVFYGDSTNILWSKVLSDDGTTYREESASTST